jgi:hypothetical protein
MFLSKILTKSLSKMLSIILLYKIDTYLADDDLLSLIFPNYPIPSNKFILLNKVFVIL